MRSTSIERNYIGHECRGHNYIYLYISSTVGWQVFVGEADRGANSKTDGVADLPPRVQDRRVLPRRVGRRSEDAAGLVIECLDMWIDMCCRHANKHGYRNVDA